MSTATAEAAVQLIGIGKAFAGVQALRDVSLTASAGAVTGLVGENGAGKTTLLKILAGVYKPDRGRIALGGVPASFNDPAAAQAAGIAIIHQEVNVLPHLSVAENIYLSHLPRRGPFVDWPRLRDDCAAVLDNLRVKLDPETPVGELSLARQQMVEIARAIAQHARILAMDEPTASLSSEEVAILFSTIRQLTAEGVTVIFVSHRLEEVFEIADPIAVLRDGQMVGTMPRAQATTERVIELMVGRPIDRQFPKEVAEVGPVVLEVEHLSTEQLLRDVSLTVHRGEVVGLAGLVGAGRTELARAIFGVDRLSAGSIRIQGREVRIGSPADAIRLGIGFVPEDRKRSGLLLRFPLYANHTLPSLRRFVRSGRVVKRLETSAFQRWTKELSIHARDALEEARDLSGGNQQKVVLAKWLELSPQLLILDEPTRGIDVGAKVEIYDIMNRLVKSGTAILMISSDLPEVLGMSDRIVVMHEGRITGEFARGAAREQVMEAAIA